MIALLQRVRHARVEINRRDVAQIGQGILVFAGFQPVDDESQVSRMLDRILSYRIFADEDDKMNRSVQEISGGLLLVPQFTLAADTGSGRRPGFSTAAKPEKGKELFQFLIRQASKKHEYLAHGEFGADMQVHLQNDGPVTFILH